MDVFGEKLAMRNLLLLSFTFLLAALAQAEQPVSPPALLTIHNSSTYKMTPVVWRNGKKCTDRMRLDDSQNPNQTDPKPLAVYSLQLLTVAVGIFEMEDKAPVQCEWSRSFRPQPGARYRLDLDVQDRHCYGNLFR